MKQYPGIFSAQKVPYENSTDDTDSACGTCYYNGISTGKNREQQRRHGNGRKTGHTEAVQVIYDPKKITYEELLDIFWKHIYPTDTNGQFADRGAQYRPAIFYHDDEQKYIKPGKDVLKNKLTTMQYTVTQMDGTEPPFKNEYWNHKKEGIYVDIVTGEPLFSSGDRFDSGTGWPSYTRPLEPGNVVERSD